MMIKILQLEVAYGLGENNIHFQKQDLAGVSAATGAAPAAAAAAAVHVADFGGVFWIHAPFQPSSKHCLNPDTRSLSIDPNRFLAHEPETGVLFLLLLLHSIEP